MHVELQDATVQGLINVDTGEWDSDVLRDICNDRDRELILRVPLPSRRREDSWVWLLDDKGKFTVKSVYRSLQGENNMEDSSFWRKLWSLKIPGKVLNFMWRVCKGCLPTAATLVSKRVNISG